MSDIKQLLREKGAMTTQELADSSEYEYVTVHNKLSELLELKEVNRAKSKRDNRPYLWYVGNPPEELMEGREQYIVNHLADSDRSLTATDIARNLNIRYNSVLDHLRDLHSRGVVEREGDGTGPSPYKWYLP